MATRKSTKRSTGRKQQRNGFLRAILASAATSFVFFSVLLNPKLADWVGLDYFDVVQIARAVASEPVSTPQAGRFVQTSFKGCREFFPNGKTPVVPAAPGLRELCFSGFAVLHSGQTKTPVFVAQRLNKSMLQKAQAVGRTDRFYAEARLPAAERAELDDYRGSGYARGHMAPAGDMHSDEAMAQSFSLANMVPQDQRQNSGPWNKIEQDTRKYIMRAKGDVYVITGSVYGGRHETIGAGRVAVPTYLYKLVYDATTGRSWVHWQENSPDAKAGRPISYEDFVERVRIQFQ